MSGTLRGRGFGAGLVGAGLGAGLMYLMDPRQGRRRRAVARDKLGRAVRRERRFLDKGSRDLRQRVSGALERASHRSVPASDEVLLGRVRAALGRVARHPGAVEVLTEEGRVLLRGQVPVGDRGPILRRVARVPGVSSIDNQLDEQPPAADRPAPPALHRGPGREVWPPAWRLALGATGLALSAVGATELAARRRVHGLLAAGVGGALVTRVLVNRPLVRALSSRGPERPVRMTKSLVIRAPREDVFRLWTALEDFPRFMDQVDRVEIDRTDARRSAWEVHGAAGVPVSFTAEVTEQQPDRKLAWRTLPGSTLEHTGTAEFEELDDGITRLRLQICYQPPAGAGRVLAGILGSDVKQRLNRDLVRFKSLLEDGRTHAHHQTVTRDQLAGARAEGGDQNPNRDPLAGARGEGDQTVNRDPLAGARAEGDDGATEG